MGNQQQAASHTPHLPAALPFVTTKASSPVPHNDQRHNSTMAVPKLSYFNMKGAAESIRLAFAVSGLEFEDNRVQREEWPKLKPTTPYGSMPVLEVNGKQYAQSLAILRYAGKLGGTYPSDPLLALQVDMELDAIQDMFNTIRPTFAMDEEKKMAARKVLAEETLPKWFGIFNQHIKDNGSSGYLVGDSVTIADLQLYATINMLQSGFLDGVPASIFDPYPELLALKAKIAADEKVKEYEAKTYPPKAAEP